MKSLFLGIDVSTTGSKALLVDEAGNVVATALTEHSISTPRPLWSEQNPRNGGLPLLQSIRQALARLARKVMM